MLYFLNKHNVPQLVVLVALFAWTVFTIFSQMNFLPEAGQTVFYQRITMLWQYNPLHYKILAVLFLLLELLFLERFYLAGRFSDNQTFMPLLFYLLFINVGGFSKVFTPAWFTLFLLSIILFLNARDDNEKPVKNRTFASGLLIGLCSLLDPYALGLAFFVMMVLLTHRFSKSKEIIILLLGLLFTYAYVCAIFFITDGFPMLKESFRYLSVFTMLKNFKMLDALDLSFLAYLILCVIIMGVQLKMFYDNKLIVIRKRFVTIHFLSVILFAMMLLTRLEFKYGLLYMAVPITLYFSMLTLPKSKIIFHDIIIVAFFVLLWL